MFEILSLNRISLPKRYIDHRVVDTSISSLIECQSDSAQKSHLVRFSLSRAQMSKKSEPHLEVADSNDLVLQQFPEIFPWSDFARFNGQTIFFTDKHLKLK